MALVVCYGVLAMDWLIWEYLPRITGGGFEADARLCRFGILSESSGIDCRDVTRSTHFNVRPVNFVWHRSAPTQHTTQA